MMRGLLTVYGMMDINQFWPQNIITGNRSDSDADTVKFRLDAAKGFEFQYPGGKKVSANVLMGAGMWHKEKDKEKKKEVFKPVINKSGVLTIRLQGIDAPELHYQIGVPLYRQRMGQTCTVQLYKLTKKHSKNGIVYCKVTTRVNKPNDVFDKYGRMVADVILTDKNGVELKNSLGKPLNINHWLAENGFAFPAFYNSMEPDEITALQRLSRKARGKGVWKYYSDRMAALDRNLIHDKKNPAYDEKADQQKPVIFPKLFRRLYTFEITNKNTFSTSGYQEFLKEQEDPSVPTGTHLQAVRQGKKYKMQNLSDYVGADGKIKFRPDGLVFKENPTSLKNDKKEKITKW